MQDKVDREENARLEGKKIKVGRNNFREKKKKNEERKKPRKNLKGIKTEFFSA